MTDTPPPVTVEPARKSLLERVSVVWVIPFLALVIALGVAWQSYNDRGPVITIAFQDASGIAAGQTELRYRDVTVGLVERLGFSSDLSVVEAEVRLEKRIAPFVDTGARFWVVRPEITAQGVTGLDTVLSGVFIEGAWDTEVGPSQSSFNGLPEAPLIRGGQEGLQLTFRTTANGTLTDNAPIVYRGIEVGRVGEGQIAPGGSYAIVEAIIYEPHGRLITSATRFWDTSGFSFSLGANGAEIDFSSIASLVSGGITFDTFVSGGEAVQDGDVFEIFEDKERARTSIFEDSEVAPIELSVIFQENIAGLAIGAPVEMGGFRVGEVSLLNGIVDPDTFGDARVRLNATLSIQPARMGLPGEVSPEAALDFIAQRVEEGVRARLATASILTGGLKVELIEVENPEPATLDRDATPFPVMPSTQSEIADVAATAEGVFQRINALPIEEVLQGAADFLRSAEQFISDPELRQTPGDIRTLLAEFEGLLADTRVVVGSEGIQGVPEQVSSLLAQAETVLREVELAGTVESLTAAVDAAAGAADAVSTSVEGVPDLISDLEAVAENAAQLPLREIAEQLSRIVANADALLIDPKTRQLPDTLNSALEDMRGLLAEAQGFVAGEPVQQIPAQVSQLIERVDALFLRIETEQAVERLVAAVDAATLAANDVTESVDGVPALIEELNKTAQVAAGLPLEELINRASDLVATADSVLGSEETRQLPQSLSDALREVEATLRELREGGAIDSTNRALASISDAARAVEDGAETLPQVSRRLQQLLAQAGTTLADYGEGSDINRSVEATLRDVQRAADAVASLARMLERNPNALLTGR